MIISDDVGLIDLTTELLGDDFNLQTPSILRIFTRENIIFSGENFIKDIARRLECEVLKLGKNGQKFSQNSEICLLKGSFLNIHKAWKVSQILLEYSVKISTYTNQMAQKIKAVNKNCILATTRKHHPFAKELCVKAVIAGGGTIHRLGLFDSVLFFKNHTIVYENFAKFCEKIPVFKAKMPEKKIMVECESLDEFYELLKHCPDVVVCDKFTPLMIDECLKIRNDSFKNLIIAAAGGISLKNCDEFAKSDIIITSAPYTQGVCDLGSKIEFA